MAYYFILNELFGDQSDDEAGTSNSDFMRRACSSNSSISRNANRKEKKTKYKPMQPAAEKAHDHKIIDKFRGVCRICADNSRKAVFPLYSHEAYSSLAEDVFFCTGIMPAEGDGLPNRICMDCFETIAKFKTYKENAIQADKNLHTAKIRHEAHIEKTKGEKELQMLPSYKPTINCPKCAKEFTSRVKLKNHMVNCCKPPEPAGYFLCETCGQEFSIKIQYKRHIRKHATQVNSIEDLPFKCPHCPYRGKFKEYLTIHMRTHTGEKPFSCSHCPKTFSTRSNKNKHMRQHKTDFEFKCDQCTRGFHSMPELQSHIRRIHLGLKDYRCEICGKDFATHKEKRKHQRRVHNLSMLQPGREPLYMKFERKQILENKQAEYAMTQSQSNQIQIYYAE